ncbi:MAG: hypothetical protein AAGG02_16270 [Cyanobacteria bacterium P01_H01_bin.15]
MFTSSQPQQAREPWQWQIDQFVRQYGTELAGLAWALKQEWQNDNTFGIDLRPEPHFVTCSRESLDKLNVQTDNFIQELVGVVANYDPHTEVAGIVIGPGQLKLIYFQPSPTPPECWTQLDTDVDSLMAQLEENLKNLVSLSGS